METFQALLTRKLAEALTAAGLPPAGAVTPATDARFGDYQTNAALILAKQLGENPRALAQRILDAYDRWDLCDPPTIAGAGFINFTLRPATIATRTADLLRDERLGVEKVASPKRIVIDFGSPNVAKPMHVGHIRSTVLGDALARIASFLGHDVIRDNHIGDWGTQFGYILKIWKSLIASGNEKDLRRQLSVDPFGTLRRLYILGQIGSAAAEPADLADSSAILEDDPHATARQQVIMLQSGDPETTAIWRELIELSQRQFDEIYGLLDIHYDIQRGESFYNDRLPAVVERLLKSKIAEISEGAVCVFFPDIPELAEKPAIIRKSDGGFNYATTDVATVDYRIQDLKADTVWLVVGAPQILHFKQIIAIARREGYTADFHHITFGSILGENRKLMKTRSGENVPLRDLLDEAVQRARKIIEEKNPELGESEKIAIAQKVGIGAVKYYDLSQYRMTDYIFSWDRMLSFQGNTAPYLQNAYVRIRSIFRKAGEEFVPAQELVLVAPEERNLALRLSQFAEVVPTVLNDFRPNVLANYLFELANGFHAFYEACPVLKSEEPARSSRLALCELTARVLQRGLELLGIKVPEKM